MSKNMHNRDTGITVKVFGQTEEDMEKAIRMFKKKVGESGIMKVLKHKRGYEKPSEKRIRKRKESVRQIQAEARKEFKTNRYR